ncbi:MAG: exo-alpha-sialidase [Thermoguttaceae bacterium]|nr:exo-alpha-sialidase [Thermoguttaceae bacterium]
MKKRIEILAAALCVVGLGSVADVPFERIALGNVDANVADNNVANETVAVVATPIRAEEPILIASDGSEIATKITTLKVEGGASWERIVVGVSDVKLLKRLELRSGELILGAVKIDGTQGGAAEFRLTPTDAEKLATVEIWAFASKNAGPGDKVKIAVKEAVATAAVGKAAAFDATSLEYRFGVLVRDSGWDGVAKHRIPGIAKTLNGTLIAVYDARWKHAGDLPADVDVACSRSFDGGKTWEPMQIAMNFDGPDPAKEGVGDPAILVDPKTGRIWLAALWAHNGKSIRASQPGLKIGTSGRLVLSYSDDDGASWSEPIDVTNEAAAGENWRILFQGPGCGIATRGGQLVFPAQFIDENGVWFSTLVWSGDGGKSWKAGNGAVKMTCEAQVVELNDGSLMLNMRNFEGRARSVAVTRDFGETWVEHPTSKKTLVEPICQASLIRFSSTLDGDKGDLLAFMNPNSKNGRLDMTLKLSADEGTTWDRELLLYRPGCWGYSSLVKIDDETIGALYETLGGLIFQTVKIQDVPKVGGAN